MIWKNLAIVFMTVVLSALTLQAAARDSYPQRRLFNEQPQSSQQAASPQGGEVSGEQKGGKAEQPIPSPLELQKKQPVLPPKVQEDLFTAEEIDVDDYLRKYGKEENQDAFKIWPMDTISVRVFDEDELSRDDMLVGADGSITMPLVGRVRVEGMTPREIEKRIERQYLEGGFLKDPHVAVMVKEYGSRHVLVMGAVTQPGRYNMEEQERLLDVLAKAGGIKVDANGEVAATKIRLLRKIEPRKTRSRRLAMDIHLEGLTRGTKPHYNMIMLDDDIIYVPESPRYYVVGEVRKPGYFRIKDRPITVVEAITAAGGFTKVAAGNRTRIVRVVDDKEVAITAPVEDILDGDRKNDFIIQPNDVVVVPQSLF